MLTFSIEISTETWAAPLGPLWLCSMVAQAVVCRSAQPPSLHTTELQVGATLGKGTGKASQMHLHKAQT